MLSGTLTRLLTLGRLIFILITSTKQAKAASVVSWFFNPPNFFDLAHGPVQVTHALPHACIAFTANGVKADFAVCDLFAIGAHPRQPARRVSSVNTTFHKVGGCGAHVFQKHVRRGCLSVTQLISRATVLAAVVSIETG